MHVRFSMYLDNASRWLQVSIIIEALGMEQILYPLGCPFI